MLHSALGHGVAPRGLPRGAGDDSERHGGFIRRFLPDGLGRTDGPLRRLVWAAVATLALACLGASPSQATLPDNDLDGYDTSTDCNDSRANVYPGAPELPDGLDNDCDGFVDEGLPPTTGSITIVKNTVGGDNIFYFTGDLGAFDLTTSGGTASTTAVLAPGSYAVTEPAAGGFDLTALSCDDDDSTTDLGTLTATIELAAGEDVICTFTNTAKNSLRISVETSGGDGTFGFTIDLGSFAFATTGGAGSFDFPIPAGSYDVVADLNATFVLSAIACEGDADSGSVVTFASRSVLVDLDAGEYIDCTFLYTPLPGTVTIIKESVGGNGTFNFSGDFGIGAFSLTTVGGTTSTIFTNLAPNRIWDVSEIATVGFVLTALVCDDGSTTDLGALSAAIFLDAGEDVICTFTNTATSTGSITIVKTTVGGDGTFGFTGDLGAFSLTTIGATASTTFSGLAPGTYSVTEAETPGFDYTEVLCSSGAWGVYSLATVTVFLAAGEDVTCTFTNTAAPATGTITIVKNTIGGDGTFDFNSTVLGSFIVATSGGTGSATNGSLVAGTYDVTETPAAGFVLSALDCDDDDSTTDLGTLTATIELAAGEDVICTFTNTEVADRTVEIIDNFLQNRGNALIEVGPALTHFIDRFNGTTTNGNTTLPALAYQAVTGGGVDFDGIMLGPQERLAVWAEGTFERYREGAPGALLGGQVMLLQGGFDYRFGDRLILGLTVEGDAAREQSQDLGYNVEGLGWMAGPYGAIRLGGTAVFDAKFLWGRSQNDIQPLLTYTDTFMTTRWLATARLGGEAGVGPFLFRPEVVVMYFNEVQQEYVDTNGITIPAQTVNLGRLTFGPEIAVPIATRNGGTIQPSLALLGIWNFTTPDISARLEGALRISGPGGASLQVEGTLGGLFLPDFHSWSARANFTIPLH